MYCFDPIRVDPSRFGGDEADLQTVPFSDGTIADWIRETEKESMIEGETNKDSRRTRKTLRTFGNVSYKIHITYHIKCFNIRITRLGVAGL